MLREMKLQSRYQYRVHPPSSAQVDEMVKPTSLIRRRQLGWRLLKKKECSTGIIVKFEAIEGVEDLSCLLSNLAVNVKNGSWNWCDRRRDEIADSPLIEVSNLLFLLLLVYVFLFIQVLISVIVLSRPSFVTEFQLDTSRWAQECMVDEVSDFACEYRERHGKNLLGDWRLSNQSDCWEDDSNGGFVNLHRETLTVELQSLFESGLEKMWTRQNALSSA